MIGREREKIKSDQETITQVQKINFEMIETYNNRTTNHQQIVQHIKEQLLTKVAIDQKFLDSDLKT